MTDEESLQAAIHEQVQLVPYDSLAVEHRDDRAAHTHATAGFVRATLSALGL